MRLSVSGPAPIELGSRLASVGHFVRHLLEMCAAMGIGMAVLTPLFVWVAGMIGYSNPFRQLPELSALVMAFNMAAPMAAWMRYRGMEWDTIIEMSGAMFGEVVLLIVAVWIGIISRGSLIGLQHVLMLPAMLVPMLYRRHVYMGHTGHRAHLA